MPEAVGHQTILYHANCYDGFGAAWAAWKALGDGAKYYPIAYGDSPPPLINADQGKLYLLDFTFPRQTLLSLAKEFDIVVLDHHKTAQGDLADLPFARFDVDKSGAVLAWEHFHPGTPIPELVRYLQDRDLWQFRLPRSREIAAWLRSYPMDFRIWDGLVWDVIDDARYWQAASEGEAILRFQCEMVDVMCRNAWVTKIGDHWVPVTNATIFFSEVGERLCELNPGMPFAAYYLDRADGKRQWGLRSRGGFDVSAVAKAFGGGGHTAAAGFTSPREGEER